MLLVVVPVGLCLLAYVWLHLEVLSVGYRVHELEGLLEERTRQERALLVEATHLANPELIEARAARELGMGQPAVEQLVFLGEAR